MLPMKVPRVSEIGVNITIIGVGGGGANTVTNLYHKNVPAKLIIVDTDVNTLSVSKAHNLINIGETICKGRGTGGDIALGKKSAEEDIDKVIDAIGSPDLLLLICSFGGGTGSGATPVIAAHARNELPDAVIGIIGTIPFKYEGNERFKNAQSGLREALQVADFVVVNLNDYLLERFGNLPLKSAFRLYDLMVANTLELLVDSLSPKYSLKHVDFADFKSTVQRSGTSVFGFGKHRNVVKAIEKAIDNKLLDADLSTAKSILILLKTPMGVTLRDLSNGIRILSEKFGIERILWGAKVVPNIRDTVVTFIASNVKSKIVEDMVGEVELLKR